MYLCALELKLFFAVVTLKNFSFLVSRFLFFVACLFTAVHFAALLLVPLGRCCASGSKAAATAAAATLSQVIVRFGTYAARSLGTEAGITLRFLGPRLGARGAADRLGYLLHRALGHRLGTRQFR